MKIADILVEVRVENVDGERVWVNPPLTAIINLTKQIGPLRGLCDGKNLYLWTAFTYTHDVMAEKLGFAHYDMAGFFVEPDSIPEHERENFDETAEKYGIILGYPAGVTSWGANFPALVRLIQAMTKQTPAQRPALISSTAPIQHPNTDTSHNPT